MSDEIKKIDAEPEKISNSGTGTQTENISNSEIAKDAGKISESEPEIHPEIPPEKLLYLSVGRAPSPAETARQETENSLHDLKNAQLSRQILTGTLDSVLQDREANTYGIYLYDNNIEVTFSADDFLCLPKNNKMSKQQKFNLMSSMIGAEFYFIVTTVTGDTITGSRRRANEISIQRYYLEPNRLGKYMIYENSIVQARIVAVGEYSVEVEIFGALCEIPKSQATAFWTSDLRRKYSVGQKVDVQITKIEGRDETADMPFKIEASIRAIETELRNAMVREVKPNSKYIGEVMARRKGFYIIYLKNGLDAIAHVSYSDKPLLIGDKVTYVVKRTEKSNSDNNLLIFGKVLSVISHKKF